MTDPGMQQPRWVTWAHGETYHAARTGRALTFAELDAGAVPWLVADTPEYLAMLIAEQDCLLDAMLP